jgi:hypothetical protein
MRASDKQNDAASCQDNASIHHKPPFELRKMIRARYIGFVFTEESISSASKGEKQHPGGLIAAFSVKLFPQLSSVEFFWLLGSRQGYQGEISLLPLPEPYQVPPANAFKW